MDTTTRNGRGRAIGAALLIALVVAVIAERWVAAIARSGAIGNGTLQLTVVDLATWVPLVGAIVWVLRGQRTAGIRDTLRLRIGTVDVFAAIAIACLARAVDAYLSLAFFGSTGLVRPALIGTGPSAATLAITVVGTCIVTPIIEELFFRGIVQRALERPLGRTFAVLITAAVFACAHVLTGNPSSPVAGFELAASTFVLGALLGTLTVATRRTGGAILGHMLFNAIAIAFTWPA